MVFHSLPEMQRRRLIVPNDEKAATAIERGEPWGDAG
jgi:hypothetical protein